LVKSPGVELDDLAVHLDALARYAGSKVHFVDCLLAATAAARGLSVTTFDADFRKFADVTVEVE
jgi:predicted nucleic acid-binding protein